MTAQSFENGHLLADERAATALAHTLEACRLFAAEVPLDETAQAAELQRIIAATGEAVRCGALRLAEDFSSDSSVIRLHKETIGAGRLKLQLFPLAAGESHPPHAHYNLLSCQILLRGRARIREYSLLDRLPGNALRLREEPVKALEPGDGVFTLQRRNNVHWQEGLAAGTVLLNINWQGFFAEEPAMAGSALPGRRHIDWSQARRCGETGVVVVPEIAEPAA